MSIFKRLIIIIACAILIMLNLNAAAPYIDQEPVAGIVWDKLLYDFGTIKEGELAETTYTISNNRKDTLVIENVQGSCGCLVSRWSHQPILPGANAGIKVGFNTEGKSGVNSKSVTVYTNRGYFTLRLKANVVKK